MFTEVCITFVCFLSFLLISIFVNFDFFSKHHWKDWRRSMRAAFIGWSVPFSVIFVQYLVPWVTVMNVDARGLSNYLITIDSDKPSRELFAECADGSVCGSGGKGVCTDGAACGPGSNCASSQEIPGLTGTESPMGLYGQAIDDSNAATNAQRSDLEKQFAAQAETLLREQYQSYADVEMAAYSMAQRIAFMLLTQVALFPLALSLLPGIANGAQLAKLTMPASPLPGWIICTAPVFYVPILSVLLLGVVQLVSDVYFSLAIGFYTLSSLLPAYKGESLTYTYATPELLRISSWRFSKQFKHVKYALLFVTACFAIAFMVSVVKIGLAIRYIQ
jgi:hypothetical protein